MNILYQRTTRWNMRCHGRSNSCHVTKPFLTTTGNSWAGRHYPLNWCNGLCSEVPHSYDGTEGIICNSPDWNHSDWKQLKVNNLCGLHCTCHAPVQCCVLLLIIYLYQLITINRTVCASSGVDKIWEVQTSWLKVHRFQQCSQIVI